MKCDDLDCKTYVPKFIDPPYINQLERAAMQPIGRAEDYIAVQQPDGSWVRERRDPMHELGRRLEYVEAKATHNEGHITAIERVFRREIDTLYLLIEQRTLILEDIGEVYDDYC